MEISPTRIIHQVNVLIDSKEVPGCSIKADNVYNRKRKLDPKYGIEESWKSLKDFMDTQCIGYILKHDMLFLDDPFIIITTDGLLKTLKLLGRNCIMVDATHGVTKYKKVKLTTLFVRSPGGEGIAVAFLISRQTTTEIYTRFIAHLIKETGPIKTSVFMADMDKNFKKAWESCGNTIEEDRVCLWHVHKAWNCNKSKMIGSSEDNEAILLELKEMSYIRAASTFENRFKALLQLLAKQQDPFGTYLSTYYGFEGQFKPTEWALCYGKKGGPRTNMTLESFHKHLKTNLMNRTLNVRYDKLILYLKNYIYDSTHRLKHKAIHQPYSHRRNVVHQTHQTGLKYGQEYKIKKKNDNEWEAPSCRQADKLYTLTFDGNGCSTPHECLKCVDCGYVVCAHILQCNCDEFRLHNDCKHVHALIQAEPGLKEEIHHPSSEEVLLAIKDYDAMCPAFTVPSSINQELDSDNEVKRSLTVSILETLERTLLSCDSQVHDVIHDGLQNIVEKLNSLQIATPKVAHNRKPEKQTYFPKKK